MSTAVVTVRAPRAVTGECIDDLAPALFGPLAAASGVAVDLSGVQVADIAGLGLLVSATLSAARLGVPFTLVAPTATVTAAIARHHLQRVLGVSGGRRSGAARRAGSARRGHELPGDVDRDPRRTGVVEQGERADR